MTRLRFPLSSLCALTLAGASLVAPGCGNADGGSPSENVGEVSQRAAAAVVISEIAYDPSGAEPETEWVELYNPGDTPFVITNPGIQDATEATAAPITVTGGGALTIPAKGYIVVARTAAAITGAVAGTYGTISLNNSGTSGPTGLVDSVKILSGAQILNQVDYGTTAAKGWPADQNGTAIQLSADKLDPTVNNTAANWCRATAPYTTSETVPKAGLGSPGAANITCLGGTGGAGGAAGAGGIAGAAGVAGAAGAAGAAGTAGVGGSAGSAGSGGAAAGAGGAAAGAGGAAAGAGGASGGPVPPAPGDIVITEIMADPKAVGDDKGEWFEILNVSNKTLELKDIVLRSDLVKHTVATSVVVAPGAYAVFAKSNVATENGGLPAVAYVYPGSTFTLSNDDDDIIIELTDGTLLDSVSYVDGDTTGGKSRSLSPDKNTVADNGTDTVPASAAWCHGTTTYGDGDVGTPGAANDSCTGGTGGAGGGSAGGGGAAGKAGAAGSAGKAGAAGNAGAGGSAGKAGAGGSGGKGGSAGKAGTGGSGEGGSGEGGEGGEGGSSATGGKGGASGKGGSGSAGKGGSGSAGKAGSGSAGKAGSSSGKGGTSSGKGGSAAGGAAGTSGAVPDDSTDSGCGCRTIPSSTPASPASLGLAALALALVARRKRA